MNYKQMTGVEVEELTPQRLDEILRPIADEIKNGKPTPKLVSEDDKSITDVAPKFFQISMKLLKLLHWMVIKMKFLKFQ